MSEARDAAATPLDSAAVAALVGGRAEGASVTVQGVADLASAGPGEAAFFGRGPGRHSQRASARDLEQLRASRAGLVLLAEEVDAGGRACVRVVNPPLAAAQLAGHFHPPRHAAAPGVHPTAVVEEGVELGAGAAVGPGCVVRAGARIGAGAELAARVFVGAGAVVGAHCRLHPGVVLYHGVQLGAGCVLHANVVVGADGFGYVWDGANHVKVPQVGTVIVGDDVEIGAGSCIDRATFQATEIGDGTRIDNLVQVGHNCRIGRRVVLCAGVALGGSTVLEDGVIFGGAAMSAGHVTVGSGATVVGGAAVVQDIAAGEVVAGIPAWELTKELRAVHLLHRMVENRGKKPGGAREES